MTLPADAAPDSTVALRLAEVRARIAAGAGGAGSGSWDVTLIAVAKAQPQERLDAALAAGQRVFGENYVQEARAHWQEAREARGDLELHLIGALQSNKVKEAVALFDVIQTLDRPRLARALAREVEASGRRPRLLIQVNTGEEPQKAGVWPEEADALVALCRDELGLDVRGVMAIPPVDEEPAPHFGLLGAIARRNGLGWLSMGMSEDFELAVRLGATHVRVGSAVFGPRPPRAERG
jgi:PLP dependent protein